MWRMVVDAEVSDGHCVAIGHWSVATEESVRKVSGTVAVIAKAWHYNVSG